MLYAAEALVGLFALVGAWTVGSIILELLRGKS